MNNKLWTRDYTIITVGSAVSMLGNALAGFSVGLLVLDYSDSPMLFAVFTGCFTFPQIVTPIFSGALLDRFSRKRTIYTLDYISSALYLLGTIVIARGHFSFSFLAVMCFIIGTIQSIYTVAFQSFYPLLIAPENFSKAYSIQSLLETMTAVMVPVSALLYRIVGIVPLLSVNAVCFFTAACLETQIKAEEKYISKMQNQRSTEGSQMFIDIKEGFRYLLQNRGLFYITIYFFFNAMGDGAYTVIVLPYFKQNFNNGEFVFMFVCGMEVVARLFMGVFLYRRKLPKEKKIIIATFAYVAAGLMWGYMLYMPIPVMMIMTFLSGLFNFTSYNIRISGTQSYVPDEKKGRFNGAYTMINRTGIFFGEMISGFIGELVSSRFSLSVIMTLSSATAMIFIYGKRKHVAPVYNID